MNIWQQLDAPSVYLGLVFGALGVAISLLILDAISMRSIKKTLDRCNKEARHEDA